MPVLMPVPDAGRSFGAPSKVGSPANSVPVEQVRGLSSARATPASRVRVAIKLATEATAKRTFIIGSPCSPELQQFARPQEGAQYTGICGGFATDRPGAPGRARLGADV